MSANVLVLEPVRALQRVFKLILRKATRGEQCARIVDQDVNVWFTVSDFCGHPFHVSQAREIGKKYGVGRARAASAKPRQRRFPARVISRDQDDAGTHFSECFCSDLANS